MEYILFIHNNANSRASEQEWERFFSAARASGLFVGGSEIDNSQMLGTRAVASITDSIGGFMRFDANDRSALLALLQAHPVLINGGTLELCEMPVR